MSCICLGVQKCVCIRCVCKSCFCTGGLCVCVCDLGVCLRVRHVNANAVCIRGVSL